MKTFVRMVNYNTKLYKNKKLFFIYLATFVVVLGIMFFLTLKFDLNVFYLVFTFILICVLPFVFEKKIKNLFLSNVLLSFDNNGFSIKEFYSEIDDIKKQEFFEWENIKSYKFYFSTNKHTNLTLNLKNGYSRSYAFKDDLNFEEARNVDSIFKIFISFVSSYNSHQKDDSKIKLVPGFLATAKGTIVMYIISLLVIISIVFHLYKNPQSAPLSFIMGFFIFLQLIYKRKQDKEFYNSMLENQ